jgi:hypothetical protein
MSISLSTYHTNMIYPSKKVKKSLISTLLRLYEFLSLKTGVIVPLKSNKQKTYFLLAS